MRFALEHRYTKDPDAIDLLRRMLAFNPSKRITVDEALKHKYLSDHYDKSTILTCPSRFDADFEDGYPDEMPKALIQQYMRSMMKEMISKNGKNSSSSGGNSSSTAASSKTSSNEDDPTAYELELLEEKDTHGKKRRTHRRCYFSTTSGETKYRPWMRPPTVLTFKRSEKKDVSDTRFFQGKKLRQGCSCIMMT